MNDRDINPRHLFSWFASGWWRKLGYDNWAGHESYGDHLRIIGRIPPLENDDTSESEWKAKALALRAALLDCNEHYTHALLEGFMNGDYDMDELQRLYVENKELKDENAALKQWVEDACKVYPNIDLDIERIRRREASHE